MSSTAKAIIWPIALAAIAAASIYVLHRSRHTITLRGAIIRQDTDPDKQAPIADVEVTALSGTVVGQAKSDSSGFFSISLSEGFRRRRLVTLRFRNPSYKPLDLNETIGKLYVIHLQPLVPEKPVAPDQRPKYFISNVRVRYSVKTTTELNVGSAVKTLQVANKANVPCSGGNYCSPDGKWKAAMGSTHLDAGQGDQFRNARVSCIAGPCPFTKIERESPSDGGRIMNIVALNWSDTATFLVEAEVVHPMVSDLVRELYPVIFGQTMSFSLAPNAEGPSVEAEVNGEPIVFPLGPDLFLTWAQCSIGISKDQSRVYRCELKPGYGFK
ncbi:MAG TPA: hypothetical protein VFB28_13380 [Terriglobales bacterium]|nr:hypothetical protein [Terriglobales bacterium]